MSEEVIIYRPAKTSMQSGLAKTKNWILEFKQTQKKINDPLMGWIGGGSTIAQVKLYFSSLEEATAYAESKNYPYEVRLPKPRGLTGKSYSANFAYDRKDSWTH